MYLLSVGFLWNSVCFLLRIAVGRSPMKHTGPQPVATFIPRRLHLLCQMDPNGFTWKIPKKSWEKNINPWRDSRWNSSISSGRTYETWPLGAKVFLEIFSSNLQWPTTSFCFQLLAMPRWNWQPARWICTILLGRYSLKWCLTRNDCIHFYRGVNRQWLEDSKTQRQFWACFASNVELNPTLVVLRRRDNLWIRQASKGTSIL